MKNIVDEISHCRGVDVLDMPLREARREFEIHYFSRLLKLHDNDAKAVAGAAGLSRQGTIFRKLSNLGLTPEIRRRSVPHE